MNKQKDLVEWLIEQAINSNASDIHIDPYEKITIIRFRIDGLLEKIYEMDISQHTELIGKIKILSGLRIDIHDKSQDGRFFHIYQHKRIDMRVSIMPTYYGENTVLRLLQPYSVDKRTFEELGFNPRDASIIKKAIHKPHGLILISGPTGSGKTTTLYMMLQQIISEQTSLITLEDPIEYAVPGIRQIQIKQERGFTFSTALRGILRQDPDIIMIGEIRDKDTAHIAIQTALTGHLLFSSIHAPNAASIIPRLIDMGIDPYLITSTVSVLISQRLVRKKVEGSYQGRIGVFEVVEVTDAMKKLILMKKDEHAILTLAKKDGTTTMLEDGTQKVGQGITTKEELQRVLYE